MGDFERAEALNRDPLPRLSPMAKHIKEKVGVIADRANTFWASNARRQFWQVTKSVNSLNRGQRVKAFFQISQVMQEMLDDWRDNRSQRAMVPIVRLPDQEPDR